MVCRLILPKLMLNGLNFFELYNFFDCSFCNYYILMCLIFASYYHRSLSYSIVPSHVSQISRNCTETIPSYHYRTNIVHYRTLMSYINYRTTSSNVVPYCKIHLNNPTTNNIVHCRTGIVHYRTNTGLLHI